VYNELVLVVLNSETCLLELLRWDFWQFDLLLPDYHYFLSRRLLLGVHMLRCVFDDTVSFDP